MAKENKIETLRAMLKLIKSGDSDLNLLLRQEIISLDDKQDGLPREIMRRLRIQNVKLLSQVTLLKEKLKQAKTGKAKLQYKLNGLLKINHFLAEAMGSCELCWGKDSYCDKCYGNGLPGWRRINKQQFNSYVLPVLDKVYGLKVKLKEPDLLLNKKKAKTD